MIKDIVKSYKYSCSKYKVSKKYEEFEEVVDFGGFLGAELFAQLKSELNRLPSQDLFVEAGVAKTLKWVDIQRKVWLNRSKKYHNFFWDDELSDHVKNRLARSYTSFVIEEQVEEYVRNYLGAKTTNNILIDIVFGSDVTVMLNDRVYYIHITSNSKWSNDLIKRKGQSKPYVIVDGVKKYWKRNWRTGHHVLAYDKFDESMMIDVFGNYLFEEDYLKKWLDELVASDNYDKADDNAEISQFHQFLKSNGLVVRS